MMVSYLKFVSLPPVLPAVDHSGIWAVRKLQPSRVLPYSKTYYGSPLPMRCGSPTSLKGLPFLLPALPPINAPPAASSHPGAGTVYPQALQLSSSGFITNDLCLLKSYSVFKVASSWNFPFGVSSHPRVISVFTLFFVAVSTHFSGLGTEDVCPAAVQNPSPPVSGQEKSVVLETSWQGEFGVTGDTRTLCGI